MFRRLIWILSLQICVFSARISTQTEESLSATFFGGIESVASSATNFLVNAVEGPKNLLLNATRATTGIIDSAASKGLEFKARRFLEKFRHRMANGIPEFGIPPLDPFQLYEIYIETDNPEIGNVTLVIQDLKVWKLSTYSIDRLKLSLIGPSATVNLSIPDIYATGFYNVSGILGGLFPIHGAGRFEANIYNVRLYVSIVLAFSRRLYVRSFDLDFDIGSADIHLENFMGDEKIGAVMNQVLQELMPQLVHAIKPDILPEMRDSIANKVNQTIYDLTLKDLFNVFLGENEIGDLAHLVMP